VLALPIFDGPGLARPLGLGDDGACAAGLVGPVGGWLRFTFQLQLRIWYLYCRIGIGMFHVKQANNNQETQ